MDDVKNLVELLRRSTDKHSARPLFGIKKAGAWSWVTYGEFATLVDQVRGGLAGLGVKAGDRVAFIGDNSVEWAALAYATYGLEASFVPMYQAQRPSEWQFILADCAARVVVVTKAASFDALQELRAGMPELVHVIGIERPAGSADSWAALVAAGTAKPVPAASPDETSVCGFIYTSGTTGKPKGALLTHKNIISQIQAIHELPYGKLLGPDDRSLSFLPWAHSFGQTVELHDLISFGASMALNDELPKLLPNLAEVKPTVLVAVPRIFNKIYEAVNHDIAARPAFLQKIIHGGVQGAIRVKRGEKIGPIARLEKAFDDKAVFTKIRERFGGRLRYVFSGRAVLNREVAEFIDALGIDVYEGYGLTETSPIATTNYPGKRKFGSVGPAFPGVRIVIDREVTGDPKEGEILVYGPNIMRGYHHRPDENEKTLMADGGLRTGDLGHLDEDGYLYITGRIKEQYKLENGKYVMPSPLEEDLKLSPFIANVMIYGDNRPFNVALVVPAVPALKEWAEHEGVKLGDDLTKDERVRGLIRAELDKLSAPFKGFERPREFVLVTEDFTPDNGFLTPTLKLKRREVVRRYGKLLEDLYVRAQPAAASAPPA